MISKKIFPLPNILYSTTSIFMILKILRFKFSDRLVNSISHKIHAKRQFLAVPTWIMNLTWNQIQLYKKSWKLQFMEITFSAINEMWNCVHSRFMSIKYVPSLVFSYQKFKSIQKCIHRNIKTIIAIRAKIIGKLYTTFGKKKILLEWKNMSWLTFGLKEKNNKRSSSIIFRLQNASTKAFHPYFSQSEYRKSYNRSRPLMAAALK